MEVAKIIYYTRVDGKSKTVPLRDLNLREYYYLEDVFYAVQDAVDEHDLLQRLKRILHDEVEIDTSETKCLRFVITDAHGTTNYIKFKPVKKEN